MVTLWCRVPEAGALISLAHCSVRLGGRFVLNDVSFSVHAGERWVLMGSNGAGKSILLKLLRGDMWPTPTGRERRSFNLAENPSSEPFHHKRYIGSLSPERQDRYVRYDWNLTVLQVITTGLFDEDIPLSKASATQRQRVQRLLRRLRLWSLRERRILSLSYGQRRRVLLARLLIGQPKILLLDEVFNGLDASVRRQLMQILKDSRRASTWVLAAHSIEDVPENATHIARLEAGRLLYAGPLTQQILQSLRRDSPSQHDRARQQVAGKMIRSVLASSPDVKQDRQKQSLLNLRNIELYRDYRHVLRRFDWQVATGEHWAIMGANGSGKSSLLMLLYGDLHPALGGTIERAGMRNGMAIAEWKRQVGYLSPELQADYFRAPSIEHIIASGRYASVGLNQPLSATDRRVVKPWLEFFDLESVRHRGPREVSYGQLRLALLARAMVNRPRLLLLDEPFTGLDPQLHAYAMAALQRLSDANVQLIIAVHDTADLIPEITNLFQIGKGGRVLLQRR